jgi:hypothetical protein
MHIEADPAIEHERPHARQRFQSSESQRMQNERIAAVETGDGGTIAVRARAQAKRKLAVLKLVRGREEVPEVM